MFTTQRSFVRAAAVATVLGALVLAAPSYAATTTASPTTAPTKHHHHMKPPSPEEMQKHVEERIKMLHTKLKITPEQEDAWTNVAQAMRDSEAGVGDLIKERHENAKTMSATEDLESYQKIAQAHADGLAKVASTFAPLYDDMSDDQKKNADTVFGSYEGHPDRHHKMMHAAPKAQ